MNSNLADPIIRTQNIGDTDIQYLYYDGDGPYLVFLHATGFLPWLWHPIAREFAGKYRVIIPYFCDHRTAVPEEGGLSWEVLARDFHVFCDSLDLGQSCFIGHSMGGTIITIASALHNITAEKMIMVEPIYLPRQVYTMNITVEQHPLAAKSIKRKNDWDNIADARQYLLSKKLFQTWDSEMLELYLQYGMMPDSNGGICLACSPRHEASLFMGSRALDPWPLLPDIDCPTLIVEGELSENRQFINLSEAVSLLPKGEYRMVKGAGHLIPMEKPGETVELISNYLSTGI